MEKLTAASALVEISAELRQMWTGSAYHNVSLRRKATKMGYSLSQYGLKCKSTGEVVEFKSEEELYKALNTPFKKPEDR